MYICVVSIQTILALIISYSNQVCAIVSCKWRTQTAFTKGRSQHHNIFLYTDAHTNTYRGFPVTEQVRLSESPSRKMPEGGTILTVGATVEREKKRRG